MDRLYSTCQQADGYHWLVIQPDGLIIASSDLGFDTEFDALKDIGADPHIS